jgi:hypothetical protein
MEFLGRILQARTPTTKVQSHESARLIDQAQPTIPEAIQDHRANGWTGYECRDPLSILSMQVIFSNIWRLMHPYRKTMIRRVRNLMISVHIICLQEIEVAGFKLQTALSFIWSNTKILCSSNEEGKSSIVILLLPIFANAFTYWGVEPAQRSV